MNRFPYLAIIATLVAGCSNKDERSAPGLGSAAPAPAVPLAVADAPPSASDAALANHMRMHFAAASDLQRAIARGHLEQAKEDARWLFDHDDTVLDAWKPFVAEMRRAASDLMSAPDLPTAGVLAAKLGRACSGCHEAQTAVVTFAWEPPPEDAPALATQMKRHQWAAARLWEGLVGPSDELWNQGAVALSTMRLDTVSASGGISRGDVPALAGRVRELAIRATTTTIQDARSTLYGELLSTCAGCHALVRPDGARSP